METLAALPEEATEHTVRTGNTLTFDLHPLYGSILQNGSTVREGEVLGLDGDLRRVLIAPFGGTIRLLTTGTGADRRVRVFLTEKPHSLYARSRR